MNHITDEQHEQLLRLHCGPPLTSIDMAAQCGLTLTQLADWLASDRAKERLAALRAGVEMNNQMYHSQHRGLATSKLVDIVTNEQAGPETRRRAAKDLLTIDLVDLPAAPKEKEKPADKAEPVVDPFNEPKDPEVDAIIQECLIKIGTRDQRPKSVLPAALVTPAPGMLISDCPPQPRSGVCQ